MLRAYYTNVTRKQEDNFAWHGWKVFGSSSTQASNLNVSCGPQERRGVSDGGADTRAGGYGAAHDVVLESALHVEVAFEGGSTGAHLGSAIGRFYC